MSNTTIRTLIEDDSQADGIGRTLEVDGVREFAVSVSLDEAGGDQFLAAMATQSEAVRRRMCELTIEVEADGGEAFPKVQRTRFPDARPAKLNFRVVPRRVGDFVLRISLLVSNRVLDVVERRYLAVPASSNRRP